MTLLAYSIERCVYAFTLSVCERRFVMGEGGNWARVLHYVKEHSTQNLRVLSKLPTSGREVQEHRVRVVQRPQEDKAHANRLPLHLCQGGHRRRGQRDFFKGVTHLHS